MADKNNDCYHIKYGLTDLRPKFCNECGSHCVLVPKKAPVLKNCDETGAKLWDVYIVCSQRNTFKNRLKRFFMIGYSHTDQRGTTVHFDDLTKVTMGAEAAL